MTKSSQATSLTQKGSSNTTPTKPKPPNIHKKLHTELQSLIAFAIYKSPLILQGGKSSSVPIMKKKMREVYFPTKDNSDDQISFVDMFRKGLGVFEPLFNISKNNNTQ